MTADSHADSHADEVVVTRAGEASVYAVKGGNHVTNLLTTGSTSGALDAIAVRADPGGGPPPHRHEFGEWFHILEGTLEITGDRDGEIVTLGVAGPGDSVWVPPNCWHGTVNSSNEQVRFLVVGQPGVMTDYFAQAGVPVADDATPPASEPPGPAQVRELAERCGITFWGQPGRG